MLAGLLLAGCAVGHGEGSETLFKQDFEKEEAGKEIREMGFVAIGTCEFKVTPDGRNKVLELAPFPLDTAGFLFGPTESENVVAQARFFGTASGRRYPLFAVGLNGLGGYMLRLQPVRKVLELLKGDEVKKSVPYAWSSNTWTVLALSVRKSKDGVWSMQGKAWEDGKDEPKDWLLSWDDTEKPKPGRAAVWAVPYSGEPIRIDDLVVTRMPDGK